MQRTSQSIIIILQEIQNFPNTATSIEIATANASPLATGYLNAQHLNVNLAHNHFLTHPY
jgi:hypothetical protein